MAVSKAILVKVTAANGDGPYLINPVKIIMVCGASKEEEGKIVPTDGTHILLEEGIVRHVLEPLDFFEKLLAK